MVIENNTHLYFESVLVNTEVALHIDWSSHLGTWNIKQLSLYR